MPFKTPITVQEAVNAIHEKRYLLPGIQREFVWDDYRMCRLFDSLMRDYPIGSLLFWKVPVDKKHDFQFYEFLRNYHEKDCRHNLKADVHGQSDITAILDGQQRLASLYIGLKGVYAQKIKWYRWNNPKAFPKRKMYLNVATPLDEHERSQKNMLYDFTFLTTDEAKVRNERKFWFRVGKILDFDKSDPFQLNKYLKEQNLEENDFAGKCLFKLRDVVQNNTIINYFEEEGADLERALDVFVRTNSAGVPLSYSDILLSIATSQWRHLSAREEINGLVDNLNEIGNGFNFDKNFVLKASLVLTDEDVRFRLQNFGLANMLKIEDNWEGIKRALTTSVHLVSSFGFNAKTLTANNSLIPVAYYLKKVDAHEDFITHSKYKDDRESIRRWLITALLKQLFGGQSDRTLRTLRDDIMEISPLPFAQLERRIQFTDEEVEELLDTNYGTGRAFLVLSLLYPTLDYRNLFHMDHIHPKSLFTPAKLSKRCIPKEEQEDFRERHNRIGNIQLLEGADNLEKRSQDFEKWLNSVFSDSQKRRKYMNKNYIPLHQDLCFEKFPKMFDKREKLIARQLKELLQVNDAG